MAKDVKKTQKNNKGKEEIKKQPKKGFEKNKKVVIEEEVNSTKNIDNKKIALVEDETIETEIVTKKHKKQDRNEKKTVNENKIKDKKNNSDKVVSIVKSVDDNRKAILFGVVGFLLATLLFRCILWPDRIATLKDGTQPVASVDGKILLLMIYILV